MNKRTTLIRILNCIFLIIFCLFYKITFCQQNQYIDLHPSQTLINPIGKPGWSLVFDDEFNGSKSSVWSNAFCSGTIGPDNNPYYFIDANYSFDSSSLSLITKREAGLNEPYGYITKYFSSAQIKTDLCDNDTLPESLPNGVSWTYGFFEIRCKNPKSHLMWPAFWLLGERNSHSAWNEIDVFEYGVGDDLVMSNHYGYGGKTISPSLGKWMYSLPGQTFGDTWVTYSMMWDPDKIIWFIDNVPVRVQTTKDSVLIPNSAMHLTAGTGFDFSTAGYDLNLPEIYPNAMQIDYIRVYQRPDYLVSAPSFTINNQQSFIPQNPINVPYSNTLPVYINASQSYMPDTAYFISIQNCDINGNLSGIEASGWLDSSQIDSIAQFDVNAFAQSNGLNLLAGNYYRIKLAGDKPWTESDQYIFLSPCINAVSFKINGMNETTFPVPINITNNYFKPRIILDASNSVSCSDSFFISIQQCDVSGIVSGNKISEWILPAAMNFISGFDIEYLCNGNSFPLQYGNYYLIKLATGDTAINTRQVIYINPCNNNISFMINGDSSAFPMPITIKNGQSIFLDGSACSFCTNAYYVSIQQCDISGNPSGVEVSVWNQYMAGTGPYYYFLGRYDLRSFCQTNNISLDCGNYYRIKIMSGDSLSQEVKIIYIEPCSLVNSTFTVWASDSPPRHCTETCPGPDCCTGKEYFRLYSPNSITCNMSYFFTVQKCDYFLNPIGNAASGWLSLNDITSLTTYGTFDVHAFARDTTHHGGIKFGADGTYKLTLRAGTGTCSIDSMNDFSTIIYLGKGTPMEYRDSSSTTMTIYPNPSNNTIAVSLPYNGSPVTLQIMDVMGRELKSLAVTNEITIINVSDLSPGVYVIRAVFQDYFTIKKFVRD